MFSYFFTHPHARQEKHALVGAFFVFGVFFTLPLLPNSQNVRPSVRFGCSASSSPPLMVNTENTPPWVCFLSLPSTRHIPSSPGSHKHTKRVLRDAFFMFDTTTTQPFITNTQIVPMWARFGCSFPPFTSQHLKCDPKFAFQVFAGYPF